jgi:hypothetical protein
MTGVNVWRVPHARKKQIDISVLEQKNIPFNTKDRKALFLFNEI